MALGEGLQRCRAQGATTIHMVTHSLGGILVRAYLAGNQVPELGRVVMLGPPNQGSEVVDTFSLLPGFALWNGPAGEELGTSPGSVPNQLGPVTFPVGVIAGTRSLNPLLSTAFSEENDGKVAVSRTKVEGMTDFIALPISHPLMMREPAAIRQTLEFLRSGHFMADETASSGIQVPDPDGSQ
jgi:hypothetical protein